MKISKLVSKLNALKKKHGDIDVLLDLLNIQEHGSHDEYTAEGEISVVMKKIPFMNMDTGNFSKREYKSVLLGITEFE